MYGSKISAYFNMDTEEFVSFIFSYFCFNYFSNLEWDIYLSSSKLRRLEQGQSWENSQHWIAFCTDFDDLCRRKGQYTFQKCDHVVHDVYYATINQWAFS